MYQYQHEDYLQHHGVKGMKWGVRKKSDVAVKKAAYKLAKKEYNKSFNKAYNKAAAAYSPVKKHRQANDERWTDAANKAEALNKAKTEYKQAKKAANPNRSREIAIAATTAVGTALAAYGVYKVSKAIKDKNFNHHVSKGMDALEKLTERGRFDDGLDMLKDTIKTERSASVASIIKRTIANNSVNGKIDWDNIRKIYK